MLVNDLECFYKKFKNWYSFWHNKIVYLANLSNESFMPVFKNKFLLFLVISVGSVIGIVKGEEEKQKWVFKIKSRVDNKKQIAEKKLQAKKGGVMLDDIEMASF